MDPELLKEIKHNCDVSDAQYWGYFSICGLLMRYRDLYRSEQGLKPWADIRREDIAEWIRAKEERWPQLETERFRKLPLNGKHYDPFDLEGINAVLTPRGLVYGAGYGMYRKPTFYLADLVSVKTDAGLAVYTSRKEHVRDLFSAPGMAQGANILVRLEPLMHLLLFKFSELNSRRTPALEDAFARYGLGRRQLIDETFERKLEEITGRYAELLLLHERAEALERPADWNDLLAAAADRDVEHFVRAVKDLVADTSLHGPLSRIIETRDQAGLGMTVALMDGYRRLLFPELRTAYELLIRSRDWTPVEEARAAGYVTFRALREEISGFFRAGGDESGFARKVRAVIRRYARERAA